jgi:hypothetical protein
MESTFRPPGHEPEDPVIIDFLGLHTFPVHGIEEGLCTCIKKKPALKTRGQNCGSPGKHPVEKGWKGDAEPMGKVPKHG